MNKSEYVMSYINNNIVVLLILRLFLDSICCNLYNYNRQIVYLEEIT